MEINIPLPSSISANTYEGLKGYLKQLELAVHYAQKMVEQAEEEKVEITEDSYVCFEHPLFNNSDIIEETKESDFLSNYYDELQKVELKINII